MYKTVTKKLQDNYGKTKYKIKLRAYDNKILNASTEEIVNTVKRTGATIKDLFHFQQN